MERNQNRVNGSKSLLSNLLREYDSDRELLKHVLASKQEEDKLLAEEVKYNTELIKLENRKIEYEITQLKHKQDIKLPEIKDKRFFNNNHQTNITPITLPKIDTSRIHSNSPDNKLPRIQYPQLIGKSSESITEQKDLIPKRKMSHEHVMKALRNKVRANNQLKSQPQPQAPFNTILPTMSNNNNGTTLSSIQPKDNASINSNYVGPFSAPVRNPNGTAFPYPPIKKEERAKDHEIRE
ncbi:hypothetical protein K502DRAFT_365497 [Neoconidiobolus thromboides FSU 785]|nr:hypothetical protein K502DRAFT_365497 [Neoconidiobolus thromboides FSU 785]